MIAPTQSAARKSRASWMLATFFGVGYLRPGPGTYASAITVLLWWALSRFIASAWLIPAAVIASVAITLLGIPPSTTVARESGQKDPGFVVIDEVAGQWITLLLAPVTWKSVAVGFILFRGFDIVKPPPVRQLERLPEGTGIVADDIAAGVYALAIMQLLLRFGFLR